MKLKFNVLVAAIAALAAAGAQATILNSGPSSTPGVTGNSSVLFVAQDTALTTSITIDMGVNMADFLQSASFVNNTGALSADGTIATWSFGSNARSLNGSSVAGDYGWAGEFGNFVSASNGSYKWAVIAADNVSGAISATNTVFNRNVLSTGTPTLANITSLTNSNNLSNATSRFQSFVFGTSGGTHATNAEGASIATAGPGYLNASLVGSFGPSGGITWSYMTAIGASTNLFLTQQAQNPVVYQIGGNGNNGYGVVDTLLSAADAATFTFDGTTLTYVVPSVPEPGTYGLLLAGLAAVGFMVRRRTRG